MNCTPAMLVVTDEHAIAHGQVGAASGLTQLADGSERRFSHVMEFKTAKADRVATIKSYG